MNEYIRAMKAIPDEKNRILRLEFYKLSASWKQKTPLLKDTLELVSCVIVPYDLFKTFFMIRKSFIKNYQKAKKEIEEIMEKEESSTEFIDPNSMVS